MVGIGTRLGLSKISASVYNKILGTELASLIGYFAMGETSGATADNAEGTAARDGAYTGVTLGQAVSPFMCPLFDGVNDFVNIYSASLAGAFSGAAGTVMAFAKVIDSDVWTNGLQNYVLRLLVDANNDISIYKSTANNRIDYVYKAGGTLEVISKTSLSETGWMQLAITWDATADEVKAYYNGAQEGSTQTGLGTWAGNIASNQSVIGARIISPANCWPGYIAHLPIWTKALDASQILGIWQAAGVA